MKIRNPKPEIRKKPEARRPKLEGVKARFPVGSWRAAISNVFRISDFGIHLSFGIRISDF
jgi:hypothetical protein